MDQDCPTGTEESGVLPRGPLPQPQTEGQGAEREQLREAIAEAIYQARHGGLELSSADAVLAVLDQQGWVSREEHERLLHDFFENSTLLANAEAERDAALRALAEADNHHNAGACPYCTHNGEFVLVEASELAALREAARYEPLTERMHEGDCNWIIWCYKPELFDDTVPEEGPECSCESDLYRRVTEGEEG